MTRDPLVGSRPLPGARSTEWYKDAVIYEVHVRSYCDSDGDGVGDFRGLLSKLDYIEELGATALWLLPFYPSPLRDDGYDISDYRRVHPSYGTLRDVRALLREAHRRGIRVITELVLDHTSDEHAWFQRARRARPGSRSRDYYVWSDTPDRYPDARIIFPDFETSNWTWDAVAGAYFWHRFYAHQPNLNYDSPAVHRAMLDVVDFWLGMGVDGLRLDAIPYLYAREGTSCENLPETFAFIRELRRHIDERFSDRLLLAEANQWPEDAAQYMGAGDLCHMAFHFPLMPRMFMAARQEDRFPIVDILSETPDAPPGGQWALFLRNHDELTLEMVTDEERDYMYRAYAQDPQARVNMGIRRRLAPLLGNDRTLIEMMNALLFSLPGTPIVYYGDEIGMGDNIYLGDRNSVRTPMQWDSDRNAGFSHANPQRLFLPVVIDPRYHAQAVNVEAQEESPGSLLWWMKRLISLRRRYQAFGRGTLEVLRADNRKVLAFLRKYGDEVILVVVNLSRFAQCAQLDLSEMRGAVPVELFGSMPFPPVGDLPYFVTLGPHGFYWFSLESEPATEHAQWPLVEIDGPWESVFDDPACRRLEELFPAYLVSRRWFGSKSRRIRSTVLTDVVPVGGTGHRGGTVAQFAVVRVELDSGAPESYNVPLAHATGEQAEELRRWHADSILAETRSASGAGVLYDAAMAPGFAWALLELLGRRRSLVGTGARLLGVPAPRFRALAHDIGPETPAVPLSVEQSNTSIVFGDRAILKLVRRAEPGVNPGLELERFLGDQNRFANAPRSGGSVELVSNGPGAPSMTVAMVEELVANEGDGSSYVVDALTRSLEETLATPDAEHLRDMPRGDLLEAASQPVEPGHVLVGPHLEWASLLGRRTGELHRALASDTRDPSFSPEPLTPLDRQSLYHGARSQVRRTSRLVAAAAGGSEAVTEVVERSDEIVQRLRRITTIRMEGWRIRVHGDFHLGQVLWTGKDFYIIDFEGEPNRSLGQRRLKRPPAFDLAGMVRSFHYAARAAAQRVEHDLSGYPGASIDGWLRVWHRWVSGTFLAAYLDVVEGTGLLPRDREASSALLEFFMLEKAVYELGYEVNSRPDWVDIPARGILEILDVHQ